MSDPSAKAPNFTTTRWSVVLTAMTTEVGAAAALETLCRTYWLPLYAYARRSGMSPHDAEDATQGFFVRLLEKDYLRVVRRDAGPFRAFLQMAFKRHLCRIREHASAMRRGGGVPPLPLDLAGAEASYACESPDLRADEVFELRWALTVLGSVMDALRKEFLDLGKESEFEVLKTTLAGRQRLRRWLTRTRQNAADSLLLARIRGHVRWYPGGGLRPYRDLLVERRPAGSSHSLIRSISSRAILSARRS